MRRLATLITLVAGLFGLGLLVATSAAAHAVVVSSNPPDGARLADAPSAVSVTFDESVGLGGGGYLRVVDQVGRRVDNGSASHPGDDGTKISVPVRAGLGDGTYTASYRVVSADSHPVAGSIRFVVGNGVLGPSASGPQTVDRLTSTTFDIVRWIFITGLAVLGGGWLMFSVWPAGRDDRRARAILWTGWGAATAGTLAELIVQGPYVAGLGLPAASASGTCSTRRCTRRSAAPIPCDCSCSVRSVRRCGCFFAISNVVDCRRSLGCSGSGWR